MAEFENGWKPENGSYCKKLVEFSSAKALSDMCYNIEEKVSDGSFSRLTYDMMLAWERPTYYDEEDRMVRNIFSVSKILH